VIPAHRPSGALGRWPPQPVPRPDAAGAAVMEIGWPVTSESVNALRKICPPPSPIDPSITIIRCNSLAHSPKDDFVGCPSYPRTYHNPDSLLLAHPSGIGCGGTPASIIALFAGPTPTCQLSGSIRDRTRGDSREYNRPVCRTHPHMSIEWLCLWTAQIWGFTWLAIEASSDRTARQPAGPMERAQAILIWPKRILRGTVRNNSMSGRSRARCILQF